MVNATSSPSIVAADARFTTSAFAYGDTSASDSRARIG
jgi:hypothetical protein